MSFSQGPNQSVNPRLFTPRGSIRGDLRPAELRSLLQGGFQEGGLTSLLGSFRPQTPGFNLPPLPKIPELKAAPSRLNNPQIAGAARRQRVLAAKRKVRASTILGGSIGAEPERRALLGV